MLIELSEKRLLKNTENTKFVFSFNVEQKEVHCGVTVYPSTKRPIVILTELLGEVALEELIEEAATSISTSHFSQYNPKQIFFFLHQPHRSPDNPLWLVDLVWDAKSKQFVRHRLAVPDIRVWAVMAPFYGFHQSSLDENTFTSATVIPIKRIRETNAN
jgi:hypothetical protein